VFEDEVIKTTRMIEYKKALKQQNKTFLRNGKN